jgi:abortive infection bacteriophage resistance protein
MELERQPREKFVTHYKSRNEQMPIWAAIEILSFSTVSKMYSSWQDKNVVKKTIQDYNTFNNYKDAKSIVHSLVYLRNMCAHQARIWNKSAVFGPPDKHLLQPFGVSKPKSIWRTISVLMLLIDEINQNRSFSKNVLDLCKQNNDFYNGLLDPTL